MLTDGRTDDGRTTDARVTGILIAHLGAFGSGELKICRIYQYRNSQYRNNENVAVLTHLVTVLTYAVKKVQF